MSVKLELLEKRIQTVEQLISDRLEQNASYTTISQSLQQLKGSLEGEKLILQIVGSDIQQVQALHKLLRDSGFPQEHFLTKIAPLTEIPDFDLTSCTPTLRLENGESSCTYDLLGTDPLIMGRKPDKAQILLADHFNLVSGIHAELRPLPDGGWQIRDRDSRNGVYINGSSQKLRDWHTLAAGDQISLGSASAAPGSAMLISQIPTQTSYSPALAKFYELFNCNVLCLVTSLDQPFSEVAQRLIQRVSTTSISRCLIVAVISGGAAPELLRANLTDLESWVQGQLSEHQPELYPLFLNTVASDPRNLKATLLMPYNQPEFERLCQSMENLTRGKTAELIRQRVMTQLLAQINGIEAVLKEQMLMLGHQLQQAEENLKTLSQTNPKEQVSKALNKVSNDKDQVFRQIKTEISQSETLLLDDLNPSSLPFKVQRFIKSLKPVVFDRGGRRHIRLRLTEQTAASISSGVVHDAAVQLCRTKLAEWALEEWRQIGVIYGGGGLKSLLQRSYATLNAISLTALSPTLFQVPRLPDIQPILDSAVVDPSCGVSYKQISLLGYLFKNVKGQVISGVALLTLVGGAVFGGIPAEVKRAAAGPLLIAFTVGLYLTYRQEALTKVEDATEKIRKEIGDHYQNLVKTRSRRLVQQLNFAMEMEERQLRETIEAVKEQYAICINDLEKTQLQLKTQIEENKKAQQKIIAKDLPELQKLKQELLTPEEAQIDRADPSKRVDRPSFSKRRQEAS